MPEISNDAARRCRIRVLPAALALLASVPLASDAQRFRLSRPASTQHITEWHTAAFAAMYVHEREFLDSATVAETQLLLRKVVELAPELAQLRPEAQHWAIELIVEPQLADPLIRGARQIHGHLYANYLIGRTGVVALDSLNRLLGADSVILRIGSGPGERRARVIRVVFRYAMNIPRTIETYRHVPEVLMAISSPDDGVQTGNFFRIREMRDNQRLIEIRQGLGDCTIVCPEWMKWTFITGPVAPGIELIVKARVSEPPDAWR